MTDFSKSAAFAAAILTLTLPVSSDVVLAQSPQPQQRSAPQAQPVQPAAKARPKAAAPATPADPATPQRQTSAQGGEVVARVGGRDISTAEVQAFLAGMAPDQRAALAKDPAMLSQALRIMLANQLVLKEANDKNWQDQPAVAAQLAKLRDDAIIAIYLQSVSIPPANYPDEAEIQKTYEANKSALIVPRQFRLAQIFLALPDGADKAIEDQVRKKLAEVQLKLKQPKADFAAIAKENSMQAGAAENGGDLGWVAETMLIPEIKTQVMGMTNNAVSEPIKLADGFHIVKLIETKAAATRPLAEVRAALVQRLRADRAELLRRAYLARILEQNPPAINELALSKVFEAPSR
ncbi:MAG: peptidylprolyl isomerase [Afipia broomeae]|jgi:parvulin-like peptidyl-prolyl isomerase|uniref:Parvulin-like PPIase n=1 Tax=Candidatus Afipia apatlaquensis TaxID=2712852 RepID=A0A7C9RH54_9BRAD|nr:peptidylprolyl isomerase [Candidatus Afipia apatlaquensis]RTL78515.1 MAG: peptidylprolyl isomerase [Bradyrhizobiaceae bacterium]